MRFNMYPITDQDMNPAPSSSSALIHSLIFLYSNPTPSTDSGYDGINEPYRPDDQLATTSTPGQLIKLLESKLAQGSNVRISLSNDEAED
ncbi:hypothetical protein FIE12Z_7563 [Fusarium flagelliforme]|uniref:Uncharacterized protein n=1 Tax=Fusarium flagelliforme TaxID=2675880 RepID=A0A395MJK3_9HYPO|nr:hypothetical protein FIE12Z_7563 [Fusarium flagelliforme]